MTEYEQNKLKQSYQNKVNNAQGQFFEKAIEDACLIYSRNGRAEIAKTPEPFRVTKKHKDGKFTGRFTKKAEPDFKGTLNGGKSICFEAKYTTTDRMKRNVLTDNQMEKLECHERLGALARVCIGIQGQFYFLPWSIWRDMKIYFGRQYVKAEDIESFKVKFTGAVRFLDYVNEEKRRVE